MGSALYIVLEGVSSDDVPALVEVSGKAAAARLEQLDGWAEGRGVTPLSSFVSMGAEAADLLDEEVELEGLPIEESWWPATEPLATVLALQAQLASAPSAADAQLLGDLAAYQRVLEAAQKRGAGVRFAFDI